MVSLTQVDDNTQNYTRQPERKTKRYAHLQIVRGNLTEKKKELQEKRKKYNMLLKNLFYECSICVCLCVSRVAVADGRKTKPEFDSRQIGQTITHSNTHAHTHKGRAKSECFALSPSILATLTF